ncbi:MAG TPA: hypothetical protein VGK49_12735, partial [Ilumatobacteraceae bacterium]
MTDALRFRAVRLPRHLGRLAAALGLVVSMGVASIVATSAATPSAAAAPLGAGGEYHALEPARILDTRIGINDVDRPGVKTMTVEVSGTSNMFEVQILGQGGLPSDLSSVLAVAVNVTVVWPNAKGYLRVWGKGEAEGGSSLVNFESGEVVPNSAIIRPGAEGKVNIRLTSVGRSGTAHVLIDVFGWFSTNSFATNGARLIPVGPGRVFDSRHTGNPFGPGEIQAVQIRGADSSSPAISDIVPNRTSVVGVLANITAVNGRAFSTGTYVSVRPDMPPPGVEPPTSNLNVVRGQIKPNLVLVPVNSAGQILLYNHAGDMDLIVDVVAYLEARPADTREGRVVPLTAPFRVFDTRQGNFGATPLAPGKGEDWSFEAFANDVKIDGEWVGAQAALIGNLTATNLQRPFGFFTPVDTFLTAYPTPPGGAAGPPPEVSNLNLVEGRDVPNMALLPYGEAYKVRMYNFNGFVDYLLDATAVVLRD